SGGLAFNIGNIAGCALGLQALLGLDPAVGAVGSAIIALVVFLVPEAGRAMDRFAQVLGAVMIVLALYVTVVAHPPYAAALRATFMPARMEILSVVTIVGGTVGGY